MIRMVNIDLTRCLAGTFIIGIIIIGVLCSIFLVNREIEMELGELKQVHVIFSHGERTPTYEETQLFPLAVDYNETYYPYGYGALTNNGKMQMYKLGVKLKKHYKDFLGDKYKHDRFIMQTIDSDIHKMSALLLAAGVWPVETDNLWNIQTWQPIPYKTIRQQNDFLDYENNCPLYIKERDRILNEYMLQNDLPYTPLFELLNLYTGSNITQLSQVKQLQEFMNAQSLFTNSTPRWYRNLERIMMNVIRTEMKLKYKKNSMKDFSAGYLFKKVYLDTETELEEIDEEEDAINKMYCYSVDINNIMALLSDTKLKHVVPKLGSVFIIELYSTLSHYNQYVYKFNYYDGVSPMELAIELHRCEEPCFIHNFKNMISKTIHKDYEIECNS